MAQQHLDFGTARSNDGETIHEAFKKIEVNTNELYARIGGVSTINGEEGAVVLDATDIDISALVPNHYTPADTSIEGHLGGIDDALANGSNYFADRTTLKATDTASSMAYLGELGREGVFLWSASDLSAALIRKAITSTAVYPSTDLSFPNLITKAAHDLETGHAVFPTTSVNGLTANTLYYVIRVDVDNIRLASTFLNAHAGTAVALSGNTNFTLKRHGDPGEGIYVIPTGKAIDGSEGAWIRHSFQTIYNAKWFGAKGDDATDDTAAIQFTLDALPNTGAEAYFPRGQYLHSYPIRVGDGTAVRPSLQQAISIRGDGVTSGAPELGLFAVPSPTTFKYTGALDGTAWFINGAIVGFRMRGFEVNGNALAGRCMRVRHVMSSEIEHIITRGWRNTGIEIDAHRKILDQPIYGGCSNNTWRNVRSYGASIVSASAALILGVGVADIGDEDVNRNTFISCMFIAPDHAGASGALLRYCDLINFIGCFFYSPGSISAAPIRVVPPTGNAYFPSGICFYNSSMSGQMVIDPAWQVQVNGQNRGLHFYPFTSDSLAVEPTSNLVAAINGFDMHGAALGRYQPTTFKGGVRYRSPAVVDRDLTAATIANSTTVTTLYSYTVPANMLGTDGSLELDYSGSYFNNSGGPSNFLVEVLYGSSLIFSSGNLSQAADAGARAVAGNVRLSIRNAVAAQQAARARFSIGAPASVGTGSGDLSAHKTQVRNNLTEDSATALALIIRVTHGTANSNIIFKLDQAILTLS